MSRAIGALVLAAGLAGAAALRAQTPAAAPHGLILGVVVDAATGRGVANAAVRLRGQDVLQTRLTDDRGRYYMTGLPAGDFTIDAIKTGYFDGAYGRTRAGGDRIPLTLLDGQSIGDANISLWRPAVLAGVLVDELNEPLVGVRVQALRRQFVGSHLRLVPAGADTTDDEGAYRIFGLLPGPYVISVPGSALSVPSPAALTPPPEDGRARAYPTLYYPGTTFASISTPIDVAAGEIRSNVTLQLAPVATARVSGIVSGPGGPVGGQVLRLIPRGERDLGLGFETGLTISGPDGRFLFGHVPAGEYDLKAQNELTAMAANGTPDVAPRVLDGRGGVSLATDTIGALTTTSITGGPLDGDRALWGEHAVSVSDRDVDDVDVGMTAGFTLTARAAFEGRTPAPAKDALRALRVTLEPIETDRDPTRAFLDESGAYVMRGVAPGRYVVAVEGAPAGWTLDAARLDGRDVSAAPFDLRDDVDGVTLAFTDHPATLTGAVRDAHGFAAPGSYAAIFPADDRDAIDAGVSPRRIRGTRTAASGVFTFGALPPGDYWLVGLSDAISEGWQAPDSLRALQKAATRVTIRAGASQTQDVTIVSKPPR